MSYPTLASFEDLTMGFKADSRALQFKLHRKT
jgi:hypothetical protein